MTFRLALGLGLSTLALGPSAPCSAQPAAAGEPIVVGQRFELRSESLGELRSYQVHRPPNYEIENARYPVLIVLDGEWHFQHVSTTVDFLADAGQIPAMLVIGIPNTDRNRDMDSAAAPGSSPFLTFITDELIPKIDRDYRTHPHRTLVGHSGAGLYALYSMINAPEVFRGYIVIAPAFGDNRELPKTVATFNYNGPIQRLRNRLNGQILDAIRVDWLALRSAVETEEKIKIVEFGDGRFEYYPKIITTRPFTESELVQVEAARQKAIAAIQSALENEGATNIVIYSSSAIPG